MGDILTGVDGVGFCTEKDMEAALKSLTGPWHFGKRIFELHLERPVAVTSDTINNGTYVETFQNDHSFWVYVRVASQINTVDAIEAALGMRLRRQCVFIRRLHRISTRIAHTFCFCVHSCVLRGKRDGDGEHVILLNHTVPMVASVSGEAARVGIQVGDIIHLVNGKRQDGVFPPVFAAQEAKDRDEALFDSDGYEIGVVEIVVLRTDKEQV